MRVQDITSYLESLAPLQLQESYDNAGLIVGSPQQEVTQVLLSLDCTEAVVDEAIEKGCNLIISHHPIVFGGLKKINGKNYVERVVIKAIKNDIALYAIHTNLDNVFDGVNAMIMDKLGIADRKILSSKTGVLKKLVTFAPTADADKVRAALFEAGAGNIGNYSEASFNAEGFGTFKGNEQTNPHVGEPGKQHQEPELKIEVIYPAYLESKLLKALFTAHPYEEVAYDLYQLTNTTDRIGAGMVGELDQPVAEPDLLESLKTIFNVPVIRHTALLNKPIKKVAVCGGAGSFLLGDAMRAGADIFITGDFKYHQFFDAEDKLVIADIGHYESEQFTPQLLADILNKKFSSFAFLLSGINTNPINYL